MSSVRSRLGYNWRGKPLQLPWIMVNCRHATGELIEGPRAGSSGGGGRGGGGGGPSRLVIFAASRRATWQADSSANIIGDFIVERLQRQQPWRQLYLNFMEQQQHYASLGPLPAGSSRLISPNTWRSFGRRSQEALKCSECWPRRVRQLGAHSGCVVGGPKSSRAEPTGGPAGN